MAMRKILVDETNRELCEHGTVGFPMTVNHDDLWAFEGKSVPIHWHNDLEISLPREGEAIYQVYRKSYTVRPGDVLLLNRNVPHSCHSPNNSHARYSTFLTRPDFIYGEYGSDVERRCFRPFLQNSSVPCILLTSGNSCTRTVIQKLNETEALFDQKTFCYELKIKGLLCEIFGMILCEHQNDLAKFVPANQLELERLEQMLNYLNTHFESIISLQELADQVHLSREVCCRMDIILGFCVRNHSGIDLHDTDIDFFRPIVFQKRTAPLTYYASMRLFFFIICVQSKPGTYLIWLHPKCVIYQNNMDSVFMSGISGDQELTADGIRGFAVKAFSGFLTWSFDIKSLCISCSCYISGTLHCAVKIRTDFVYTYNKDYFFRALGNAGYTVGIAVNIDKDAIICDCIGTG